jgi:hypothetical protein
MKHLEDMKSNKVRVENEISNIPPEQATDTATMDANSKNDSGDSDEKSDDDNNVLHNKNYQKSSIFDDDDDNNDSEQQNADDTKTSAEVIAGTNRNDYPNHGRRNIKRHDCRTNRIRRDREKEKVIEGLERNNTKKRGTRQIKFNVGITK